ncbi:MAG: hypothetical protein GXY44_04505 [Phycisphaerales bacterium]|nr:hypothetical protein [Phycisphaerales bacterium]
MNDTNDIKLWTWQLPDWDITRQKRDLSYIEEAWGEYTANRLRTLYDRLHRKLGTEEFLFCTTQYTYWAQLEIRRLWVLDVPREKVFCYISSPMWEALVSQNFCMVTEEEAWQNLILDDDKMMTRTTSGQMKDIDPLIKVPIHSEWVVDNTKGNMGKGNMGIVRASRSRYEDLPTL